MKPLASEWADFDQKVVPVKVTDQQRYLMKLAFHGGAIATLAIVRQIVTSAASDEQGVRAFDALVKECEQFVDGLRVGKS